MGNSFFVLYQKILVPASLSLKAPSPFSQAIYQEKPKISQIVISTIYSIANHTKTTCVSCTSATILQAKRKKKNKIKQQIQDMQQDIQHASSTDVFGTQDHSYKQPHRGTSRWLDIILQTLDCQV